MGSHNLNVTTSVQAWSNGEVNAGWVFVDDSNNDGINFRTSEHGTTGDRPLLSVTYTPTVYYSVGTNTADLKTGAPDITINAGVATLDVAQTKPIGVGDVIDHDVDNKLVYIWDVISDTEFRVQTGAGTLPANVSGVTVNSIQRAFNAFNDAVADSDDVAHLGNGDLTVVDRRLTWVAYKDGVFSEDVTINGYTTDATRFVTLTVAGADQVVTGASQRHVGVAGTGAVLKPPSASGIQVRDDYLVVEWLEIDGSDQVAGTPYGIDAVTQGDNGTFQNLLVHEFNQTANGSCLYFETNGHTIRNNIAYNCGRGIRLKFGDNNVVSNCTLNAITQVGVYATDSSVGNTVENVIAVGSGSNDFQEQSGADFAVFNNNISEDGTAGIYGGSGHQTGVAPIDLFFSLTSPTNLHLRSGAVAINAGKDLSAAFTNDIDGETRPISSGWDVGADESSSGAMTTNYRSIGTASDLVNQGTITITAGSVTVTKSGGLGWVAENRGRGDVLIEGVNEYMILRVVSDNELRLAAPATSGYVGGTYTIARQHPDIQDWYDCVDNTSACPYFTVASPDLTADDRREVGIAFNDSTFVLSNHINIQGAVTDATRNIRLTVDPGNRHNGTPGAGVLIDANGPNEIRVRDSNFTVEWLELVGCKGSDSLSPIEVWGTDGDTSVNVLIQNFLVHDFNDTTGGRDNSGIDLTGDNTLVGKTVTIRNTMIWDGDQRGIEGDEPLDVLTIENVSIDGMDQDGIWPDKSSLIIRNTIVTSSPNLDYAPGTGSLAGTHNTSSDGTAATYFASSQTGVTAASLFATPNSNLHLRAGAIAIDQGTDLSGSFYNDIDNQRRHAGVTWDRGADEFAATTAVELTSFTASPADGAVELSWETGSELDNLGFHIYRSTEPSRRYQRVTTKPIPGLGSSPVGARYTYRDDGLDNGTTYYYRLEDIETTGATTLHGPVLTKPTPEAGTSSEASSRARVTYGDPQASSLKVLRRSKRQVVLELATGGFYAEPLDDGTVALHVPGFESLHGEIPVKRTWVDAVAGAKVKLASVRVQRVETFTGFKPSAGGVPDIVASRRGTVRAGQRRRTARAALRDDAARLVDVAFQGEQKKALIELSPLTTDASGQLVLAKRLVVTVSFRGRDASEPTNGRRYRKSRSHDQRTVIAHVHTRDAGLYRVRYEDVMRGNRSVRTTRLRLSRQGQAVAYVAMPNPNRFGPGSTLHFVSAGADANPFGHEAVYELELGGESLTMGTIAARASSATLASTYRHRDHYEQDRYYQSGLVDAPDLWLWDVLFAPETKTYPLGVSSLDVTASASLRVALQGVSDFDAVTDHHVRVRVNGTLVAERTWDGKRAVELAAELAPGLLHEGDNVLELENVGDTGAAYSMVMLDSYTLEYTRTTSALGGRVEGLWLAGGTAEIQGLDASAHVLDVSSEQPQWLGGVERTADGVLRFHAEPGRRYLAMAPLEPVISAPRATRIKSTQNRADYILIGPEAFLDAAAPLLQLRQREGLRTIAVSMEDIYSEFGFGETTPRAVKDFLTFAYHHWERPSPRYVVLLGDATYDFKNRLDTGVANHVPVNVVKTTYLWTASDPSFAAVNGDDLIPDIAIGRLPAANVDQARDMVAKLVDYRPVADNVVLVADNADEAGHFEADADVLAAGVLASRTTRKIYLSRLGTAATRDAIIQSFDDGASMVSYIGHGAINLWGDENFFNTKNIASLSPQANQPLLLTMNCLNGFFHFPYFDSLAEALVKAPDKGAIAAFSPSGLSLNGPAQLYHRALLQALAQGQHNRLGDAVVDAQQRYAQTGAFPELLAIYHLFGDPAMPLKASP